MVSLKHGLFVVLLTLLIVSGTVSTFAQDRTSAPTVTPTVPVKTQVWLDLTATASAPTPGVDYTATYEAEFNKAVLTVTAQSATNTPSSTVTRQPTAIRPSITPSPVPPGPASPLDAIKTETATVNGGIFMMGTTLEEGTQAVDECALYDSECDIQWILDSVPAHQVTVDTFQMEITEVTVAQYVAFLNAMGPESHLTGCAGSPCIATTDESDTSTIGFDGQTYTANPFYAVHPVTNVTWWGAQAYCEAINRRLPTEAEWERAARGSLELIYPWGFEFDSTRANSAEAEAGGTVPVIDYPTGVSPYGIFNLAGNVQEWVYDWYDPDYYTQLATRPTIANPVNTVPNNDGKVVRGGSWDTKPLFLRTVHRRSESLYTTSSAIGFRCVEGQPVGPSTPTPTATWTPTAMVD